MSRLKADLLLLLVALIWGVAFVVQKDSFNHVGAFTFIAARFILSTLVVFPLALKEFHSAKIKLSIIIDKEVIFVCALFTVSMILQQAGLAYTSVTNAGFLTCVYVLIVPLICRVLYKETISHWVLPAALLSLTGVWLLSGGNVQSPIQLNKGDALVLLCALGFAFQVSLIGRLARRTQAPLVLSFLQYASVALIGTIAALTFETSDISDIKDAGWGILYAGILSGGIAFTLQTIAQQYAPASDSALILSSEAVFAAVAGALILGERLPVAGITGCFLIILAILMVEAGPHLIRQKK